MKYLVCGASMLALLATVVLAGRPADAVDDETPTIKQVMDKLHKGTNSPLAQLKRALKSDAPDWDKIQKTSKDFVILGAALGKNEPPRGKVESFKTFANAYYTNAKALDDAAQKEDKTAAQRALNKLSTSCKSCHTAHKGQ